MTDADSLKADYRSFLLQTVTIRRYSGSPPSRTPTDYTAAGNFKITGSKEISPGVFQLESLSIVMADDLIDAGLTLPITADDQVMNGDTEMTVTTVKERKALDGTLIALEITARG